MRVMGKAGFCDIESEGQHIQIYVNRDYVGEDVYNELKQHNEGKEVFVRGVLFLTKNGVISIKAEKFWWGALVSQPEIDVLCGNYENLSDKDLIKVYMDARGKIEKSERK